MSEKTKYPSRRRVMSLAAAGVGAAALPSWVGTVEASVANAAPAVGPMVNASGASGLSPVFAEIAARLEGLKARYLETVDPYMALDEEFRCLRFSHSEAELDRYCEHKDVRAFHGASIAYGTLLWKGLTTHARTLADCGIQEWCERTFEATESSDNVESWRRYTGLTMAESRELVRERARREAKAAMVGA